jgi:hypothetical protein
MSSVISLDKTRLTHHGLINIPDINGAGSRGIQNSDGSSTRISTYVLSGRIDTIGGNRKGCSYSVVLPRHQGHFLQNVETSSSSSSCIITILLLSSPLSSFNFIKNSSKRDR